MIQALFLDLDGVLVDTDRLHYDALNESLMTVAGIMITPEQHFGFFKGLPTSLKLDVLKLTHGITESQAIKISSLKKQLTTERIPSLTPNYAIIEALTKVKADHNKTIHVVSNALTSSVKDILAVTGLLHVVDTFQGPDVIGSCKPDPRTYNDVARARNFMAKECLIVEDSSNGIAAANSSECHWTYGEYSSFDFDWLMNQIHWAGRRRVIIPCAGHGQRFQDVGYTEPKPLIPVGDKLMIERVIDNVGDPSSFHVFVVRRDHDEKFNIVKTIQSICERRSIHAAFEVIDYNPNGAVGSILKARRWIDGDHELILANSDQVVDVENKFGTAAGMLTWLSPTSAIDASLITFKDHHPKWSFVEIDSNTRTVTRVAEKDPISNDAIAGLYWWRRSHEFIESVLNMVALNERVNGEFYTSPSLNHLIKRGKIVIPMEILRSSMHGLGTPADLDEFKRVMGL